MTDAAGADPFFTASRVVIVAGKGGVGKTTVTSALALAAARQGLRALIVELEGKSGLASTFGREPLDYDEVVLADADETGGGEVRARTLTPDDALIEYLDDAGLGRLSKRLVSSGVVDMVSTAVPGLRDIVVLGKVKQIEQRMAAEARRRADQTGTGDADADADAPDLIVIDAPAAGHAITFLRSARGLIDAVRVGPIRSQATDVQRMLSDAERTQVVLVTLPEETPVNELVETAFSLEDEVGVSLGPVVVNALYPDVEGLDADPAEAAAAAGTSLRKGEAAELAAAADFRRHRIALQEEQLARLAEGLPLHQIRLPFLFESELDPEGLAVLADAFLAGLAEAPVEPTS
ncbi:ArsA family ATPase [Iamia sp. SCSIO 61187]|uniref:ArsA family ATPase n=1 Tax=Iamia sp. SCSIO 61187 TaxID=2722752 RepID=UPI001C63404F|nr:ArsA-related P-loop ATPase [Iamia sp. SCSIO 61187]QYG94747.1 ArsA family ATPase [Iamia sp. SCSIO 61187]